MAHSGGGAIGFFACCFGREACPVLLLIKFKFVAKFRFKEVTKKIPKDEKLRKKWCRRRAHRA
jgi:hypothetical protein